MSESRRVLRLEFLNSAAMPTHCVFVRLRKPSLPQGLGKVAPRRDAMGFSVGGVDFESPVDEVESSSPALRLGLIHICDRTEIEVIGIQIIGSLTL
jgi:hypothetical protein